MAIIHGRYGQVAIADSTPVVVLASLNKFTLNQTRDFVEVTCFGDSNKVYVPGLADASGSLGGYYNVGDGSPLSGGNITSLFAAAEGTTPVTLNLTPSTLDPEHYWSLLAYLDGVQLDVAFNGAVAITSGFKAAGALTRH